MFTFLEHLKRKYNINHTEDLNSPFNRSSIVRRILMNYNYEKLFENIPTGKNGTSFTTNKGDKLHLCIRTKDNPGIFEDKNSIIFVAVHELAHMGNIYWGHNNDFWAIFKFLLAEAISIGLYIPIDYGLNPIKYCGLAVDYNPYFDDQLMKV